MLRQRREERVSRILYEDTAPTTADRARPRDPVVPGPGEHDRNCPMAVGDGRAAEEHVDRRPDAVLVRTARDDRVGGVHGQMEAGGRDVDAPGQELLAAASLDCRQGTGAGEDRSEPAFDGRGQVENDANCAAWGEYGRGGCRFIARMINPARTPPPPRMRRTSPMVSSTLTSVALRQYTVFTFTSMSEEGVCWK